MAGRKRDEKERHLCWENNAICSKNGWLLGKVAILNLMLLLGCAGKALLSDAAASIRKETQSSSALAMSQIGMTTGRTKCPDLVVTTDVGFGLVTWLVGLLWIVIAFYSTALWPILTVDSSLKHALSLLTLLSLHQSSGNGFQWRTFSSFCVLQLPPCLSHSKSWLRVNFWKSTPIVISGNLLLC
jgi:hypothetical protein